MNIEQTSTAIQSYHSEQPLVRTINDKCLAWIRVNGEVSRNEIQRALGITSRQCSCATWHLIRDGKIKPCGEKIDSVSGHTVQTLCINDTPELNFAKLTNSQKIQMIKQTCEDWFLAHDAEQLKNDILSIINTK